MLPRSIQKFISAFAALPSIGPRQATRLAFYLVSLGSASIIEIAEAARGLAALSTCPDCFFFSEGPVCPFCGNPARRKDVLAVVERPTDIIAIEQTKKFNGVYLVLGELKKTGALDPAQKLKLERGKARGPFKEILLALDQTTYGDFNAQTITKELAGVTEKITRLGRGIPTGGEIEFADEDTLGSAIEKRS